MATISEILRAQQLGSPLPGTSLADPMPGENAASMFTDMAKDVGGFGLSVVGAVGNALDLPGSMVRDAIAGENFVDQLLTPFSDVNRTSGRKLLEKMGARRNKETGIGGWFRDPYEGVLDIAGFATEIVLDPWGPVGAALGIPSFSRSVGIVGRAANTTIRKLIPRLGDSAMNFVENTASTAARVSRTYFESAVQGMKTATRQGSVAKNLTPSLTKYENDIKTLGIGTLDQMKKRGYDIEDEALWSRLVRYAEGREDYYTSSDNLFRGDIVELPEALANVRLPITDVTTLSNGDTVYKVGDIPHVRFKKDDLVKVGTNPEFIPLEDDLRGLGDMWKRELEKSRVDSYNAGQKAPLIGDDAGIEHWPRQMKDLMKYIIRQEDGMFRSSSATRQFEKHPELFRDYVLTGNRGGTEATEALLKDSEWNTIVDEVRSVVDKEMLAKDGNAFAIGKATVRHIKRYAEKLGVDPEDLWEDIGLSRTKPWVEVPELARRLEAYRGQMDQTARATFSPDAKVVNRAGKQVFEDLVDENSLASVKVNKDTGDFDLPDWADLQQYDLQDDLTFAALTDRFQANETAITNLMRLRDNGQQLFSWFADADDQWAPAERFFTPLLESKFSRGWTANLKGLKKDVTDLPAGELEMATVAVKNRIREKYGHEVIRDMPKIDDTSGYASFVVQDATSGARRSIPIGEFNDQRAAFEAAQAAGMEVNPSNVWKRIQDGDMTQMMVDRYAALSELLVSRVNIRDFGLFGNNPIINAMEMMIGRRKGIELDNEFRRFAVEQVVKNTEYDDAGELALSPRRIRPTGKGDPHRGKTGDPTGVTLETLLRERQKTLDTDRFLDLMKMDLEKRGLELTGKEHSAEAVRKYLLDTPLDPDQVADMKNLFSMFEAPPEVNALLQWFDSSTTVLKGNLLGTLSTVTRNALSGATNAVIMGDIPAGPTGARVLREGWDLARGKHIDAPDTKDLRDLATQLGMDPNNPAARSEAFIYKFMGSMNRLRLHSQMDTIDEAALATTGKAERLMMGRPQSLAKGMESLGEFWKSQPISKHINPLNIPGRRKWDKQLGRYVQSSDEHLGSYVTGHMQTFSDNVVRIASTLGRMRKYGEKFDDAFAKMQWNQVSYDPRKYTRFERQVMKRLFPFYSFMSRSVPMVAMELATNPGGGLGRTIRAQRMGTGSDTTYTPHEIQDSAAIPLGATDDGSLKYLTSLGLMHEDALLYLAPVQGVRGLLQKIVGSSNPFLKGVVEYATNTSTFFDGPMGGRRLDDLDPKVGRILFNLRNKAAEYGIGSPVELPPSGRAEPFIANIVESVAANSFLSSYLRQIQVASDPRRSAQDKILNITSGVRTKQFGNQAMVRELRDRLNAMELEMGARPITLVTGTAKLRERMREQGMDTEADRLEAIQAWLQRLREQVKPKVDK